MFRPFRCFLKQMTTAHSKINMLGYQITSSSHLSSFTFCCKFLYAYTSYALTVTLTVAVSVFVTVSLAVAVAVTVTVNI
jgi:hypothetical protein